MLTPQKELNDFLFAMGLSFEERGRLFKEMDQDKTQKAHLKWLLNQIEAIPVSEEGKDEFIHYEDQELWLEIIRLPMKMRAAIVLFYIVDLDEFEISEMTADKEEALSLLTDQLRMNRGYDVSADQMEKMLLLIAKVIKNRETETFEVEPVRTEPLVEKKSNRMIYFTGAAILLLSIVIAFLTNEPAENTAEPATIRLPDSMESEMQEMTRLKESVFQSHMTKTGLNEEDLKSIDFFAPFYNEYDSIVNAIGQAEAAFELEGVRMQMERLITMGDYVYNTPIERFDQNIADIQGESDFERQKQAGDALNIFIDATEGMQALYQKKIDEYTYELDQLSGGNLSEYSPSRETQELIDVIGQNGFEVVILPAEKEYKVEYGGDKFKEAAGDQLNAASISLLYEQASLPYVQDGESDLSYDQMARKLLLSEEILSGLAGRNIVTDDYLLQHTQLFHEFLDKLSDGENRLSSEVRKVWESMIKTENLKESTTARYIATIYEELEAENFIINPETSEIIHRYTQAPAVYRVRENENYFPLNQTPMFEKANMIATFQDELDVKPLLPDQVIQVYIQTILTSEKEAAYFLADTALSYEEFENQPWQVPSFQADGLIEFITHYDSDNAARITAVHTDGSEYPFELVQKDGRWQPVFDPAHLTWF
ncbi:hypothetical protein [Jeotgalibacillus sp. R-1-5s-1]|uniref:hypothetical protein n=1 Tax=Jeotgalibacillus sp. R-1-5s-1 TaxID=2555897 RepID=UPI00106DC154|nr:hypothetical protein [Jeotgalibacillus sp. R-1-5s-1]TFD95952.1 hypothetical protein E2491_12345 [Jeotgalibacillus sp. R-1-5s-1]